MAIMMERDGVQGVISSSSFSHVALSFSQVAASFSDVAYNFQVFS